MRREWIEMCIGGDKMYILDESPSMRREWIEIISRMKKQLLLLVSLHAEGVD